MSAVTRVIDILKEETKKKTPNEPDLWAEVDMRQKDKQNQSAVEKWTLLHLLTQTRISQDLLKPMIVCCVNANSISS